MSAPDSIFAILKESKKNNSKKLLLPTSINELKKQAARSFKIQAPKKIQSIYGPDGSLITSISEIEPGMEIVVSTSLPDDVFSTGSNEPEQQTPQKTIPQEITKLSSSPQQVVSPKKVLPPPIATKPTIPSQSPVSVGRMSPMQSAQQTPASLEKSPTLQSPGSLSRKSQITIKQGDQPPLIVPVGQSPIVASPSPISSPRSGRGQSGAAQSLTAPGTGSNLAIVKQAENNEYNSNPSPRAGSPPRSPKKAPKEAEVEETVIECLSEEEIERRALLAKGIEHEKIFELSRVFGAQVEIANKQAFKEALNDTPVIIQRFMTQAEELQNKHLSVIKGNTVEFIGDIPSHTQELDNSVQEIVNRGTFATSGGISCNFRVAVVGPHKAGKTTFARILASKIYNRILASNQYKNTMIYTIDFETIENELKDPITFYNTLIETALTQAAAQKLEFTQHLDILKQYFLKLPTLDRLTPLPPKFALMDDFRGPAAILTELSENIFNALRKSCSLQIFMTNVVTIPAFVAKACGFKTVLYLADHIDLTDIDTPCIDDLNNDVSNLPLIEFIKLMLSDSPFIVSCKDEEHLLESLELIADDSSDLRNGTETVSILDTDNSPDHSDELTFELKVQGMKEPLLIRRDDLGGCSGYLQKWDELVSFGQLMIIEEHKEKESRKAREAKLALFAKVREFASILFAGEDENGNYAPFTTKILDFEIKQEISE